MHHIKRKEHADCHTCDHVSYVAVLGYKYMFHVYKRMCI